MSVPGRSWKKLLCWFLFFPTYRAAPFNYRFCCNENATDIIRYIRLGAEPAKEIYRRRDMRLNFIFGSSTRFNSKRVMCDTLAALVLSLVTNEDNVGDNNPVHRPGIGLGIEIPKIKMFV